jgi:quinol monooxygenase YgiN
MSGPLIVVFRAHVRPGMADDYAQHVREAEDLVETEEPRVIGFGFYADVDGAGVSAVQIYPDAEALDQHLRLYAERLAPRADAAVEVQGVDVFGRPSDPTLQYLLGMRELGVSVRTYPDHQGGLLRPQPL